MTGNERDPVSGDELIAEHARYAVNDAAYVLGGLDDADRTAFEDHLLDCALCQDTVAELADLTPLLASVSIDELSPGEPEQPPATLLPRLLDQVTARRRRRSWRTAAISFAAACVLAVAVFGGVHQWTQSQRPQVLAMQSVGPNTGEVHGTVRLVSSDQGIRIQLNCVYRAVGGIDYHGSLPSYRVIIYNQLGQPRELGAWTPQPDEDVELDRASPWSRQNLSKIEVSTAQGVTMLALNL